MARTSHHKQLPCAFGAFGAVTAALTSPRKHFTRHVESLSGPRITEGVVEHSEVQSMRGNPNARRQLRDLKEADPYPPNHTGASFCTYPRESRLNWTGSGICAYGGTRGAHANA